MRKYLIITIILLLAVSCNRKVVVQTVPAPVQNQTSGQPTNINNQTATSSAQSQKQLPAVLTYQGNGFSFNYPAKAGLYNYANSGAKLPAKQGLTNAVVDISSQASWQINKVAVVNDLSPASISKLFNVVPESDLVKTPAQVGTVMGMKVTVSTIPNKIWYYAQTSKGIFEVQIENNTQGQERQSAQSILQAIQDSLNMEQ